MTKKLKKMYLQTKCTQNSQGYFKSVYAIRKAAVSQFSVGNPSVRTSFLSV